MEIEKPKVFSMAKGKSKGKLPSLIGIDINLDNSIFSNQKRSIPNIDALRQNSFYIYHIDRNRVFPPSSKRPQH